MEMNEKRESWIQRAIIAGIGILFFLSVFLIAAEKYNLYDVLFPVENEETYLNILAENMEWDYMDAGEAPEKGNVWTTDQYDTSLWKKGSGVFKTIGREGETGNYSEVILDNLDQEHKNAPSYFFRKKFEVDSLKDIDVIKGKIYYKDAVVIYLNGTIVFAGNVPPGGYISNQEAISAESEEDVYQKTFEITDLASLKEGENILSVEIHQGQNETADAYFFMEYFNLQHSEVKESAIDVESLMLEPGNSESEIVINWLTESDDFYKVEYMEASQYSGKESKFSRNAKTVLMGRSSMKETELFRNIVTLERLKTNTEYLYRVVRVGGKKASRIAKFRTSARSGYSFAVFGDPQLGAYDQDDMELWDSSVKTIIDTIGKTDFIISAGDQVDGSDEMQTVIKTYSDFRYPAAFKEIPVKTVKGNHDAKGITADFYDAQFIYSDESDDYWFTYQDTLFIGLDSNNKQYEEHRDFIEEAINQAQKKWVIVVMHHSIFSSGEHASDDSMIERRKEFSKIFCEANIDLVLSGHDHIYSRSCLMKETLPVTDSSTIRKHAGETLYVTCGSSSGNKFYDEEAEKPEYTAFDYTKSEACATRVDVEEEEITITTYTTADGKVIDSCSLVKD